MLTPEFEKALEGLTLLSSYIRCNSGWDGRAAEAYKAIRHALTEHVCPKTQAIDYSAVDPRHPCAWPTGTCRFMKDLPKTRKKKGDVQGTR